MQVLIGKPKQPAAADQAVKQLAGCAQERPANQGGLFHLMSQSISCTLVADKGVDAVSS